MIKNDRQYRVTKTQAGLFKNALHDLGEPAVANGADSALVAIQRRAIESQLEELTADVREYESLKSGKVREFAAQSLAELPGLLVKARIACGLTHKDLAGRLNVKEQQVQRWEATDYAGASLANVTAVADALGIVLEHKLCVPDAAVTAGK